MLSYCGSQPELVDYWFWRFWHHKNLDFTFQHHLTVFIWHWKMYWKKQSMIIPNEFGLNFWMWYNNYYFGNKNRTKKWRNLPNGLICFNFSVQQRVTLQSMSYTVCKKTTHSQLWGLEQLSSTAPRQPAFWVSTYEGTARLLLVGFPPFLFMDSCIVMLVGNRWLVIWLLLTCLIFLNKHWISKAFVKFHSQLFLHCE